MLFRSGGGAPVFLQFGSTDGTPGTMKLEMDTNPAGSPVTEYLGAIANNIWYYMEVEYASSSVPSAEDGILRVWWSEAGSEPSDSTTPDLEITNNVLTEISNSAKLALWGNNQHFNDTTGSINIDNVIISDTWNGAV